jgi:hypothetical protein
MCKFVHIRNHFTETSDGRLPVSHDSEISDGVEVKGGLTIAYEEDEDHKVVTFAIARCHERDNFCRRTGRVKAEGRLKSKSARTLELKEDQSAYHAVVDLVLAEESFYDAQ